MSDENITNWTEQTVDILTEGQLECDEALIHVEQCGDRTIITHSPSETTATGNELPLALTKLLDKLHDLTIEPPSSRDGMSRINVDALNEVLPDRAVVTKTAIEKGYIEVRHETINTKDFQPAHWRARADVNEVRGGKVHRELAATLDALFRTQGYRVITYEKQARYGPNTYVAADVTVRHVGVYGEAGNLSDDNDKIARCLDIGRDGNFGSPNCPHLTKSPHIYHDPPSNPVHEIVYIPFFDEADHLLERTNVELPVYTFTRTDKNL